MNLSRRQTLLFALLVLVAASASCATYEKPHSPQLVDEVYDHHRNRGLEDQQNPFQVREEIQRRILHEDEVVK